MFPHANHRPALGAEEAVDAAIAGFVGGDLVSPELRVGFRLSGVLGAAVPEAAVDEDGDVEPGEDEVGADSTGQLPTSNAQL